MSGHTAEHVRRSLIPDASLRFIRQEWFSSWDLLTCLPLCRKSRYFLVIPWLNQKQNRFTWLNSNRKFSIEVYLNWNRLCWTEGKISFNKTNRLFCNETGKNDSQISLINLIWGWDCQSLSKSSFLFNCAPLNGSPPSWELSRKS